MPSLKKCYYQVLGVERNSGDEEIKKSFRKLALQLHPGNILFLNQYKNDLGFIKLQTKIRIGQMKQRQSFKFCNRLTKFSVIQTKELGMMNIVKLFFVKVRFKRV
jgi:hypothetical protein